MSVFRVGKLNANLLDELVSSIKKKDPRVIVGPKVGEDAAVIDIGDKYLLSTTDPITFTSYKIGWYTVNVNANDIATMGGLQSGFLCQSSFRKIKQTVHWLRKYFAISKMLRMN